MLRPFLVNHVHSQGEDSFFVFAEDLPDVIDFALYDRGCFEPEREDEWITIDESPFWIAEFIDRERLQQDIANNPDYYIVIPLASPEDRAAYFNDLDEWGKERILECMTRGLLGVTV